MREVSVTISTRRQFALSPYLFMQFMESLGTTDPSVEAAWDFSSNKWRSDFLDVARELSPPLVRWPGGSLTVYYHWREAVGPYSGRVPLHNMEWGGIDTNFVGTHEFIDFCREVKADPLICVNFESDGWKGLMRDPTGSDRRGTAREAAEWVDYCNNPDNRARRENGADAPFAVPLWQIGNETSYNRNGFSAAQAAERTVAFATAMKERDPTIRLIGWGDRGHEGEWAPTMAEVAGEHLDYIAFHHHWDSGLPDSPLTPGAYRNDPDLTWHHLMNAHHSVARRIGEMRDLVAGTGLDLAMTEGHFALPGHDRCSVLASWAAGVAYARVLNEILRNGDTLGIATMADFCGSIWNVNAIMVVPRRFGSCYLMPVARVVALCRHNIGTHAVGLKADPPQTPESDPLDMTASADGSTYHLFVANTSRTSGVQARVGVGGRRVIDGTMRTISADPSAEIDATCPDIFADRTMPVGPDGVVALPAASVSALTLETARSERDHEDH